MSSNTKNKHPKTQPITDENIEEYALENLPAHVAKELESFERRYNQGLGDFPFEGQGGFVRLGADGKPYNPDLPELLRVVSAWFVKKDGKFYDVNNLQTSYNAHDIKQVITQRVRVAFPVFSMSDNQLKDFFRVLLDPPVGRLNPEESIPVWSGHTVCLPANNQKIIFKDGVVSINLWSEPPYRQKQVTAHPFEAFGDFLRYVIPKQQDRDVFLNWLAWCLKYEQDKPKWAVMLYSKKQGTGKTVLTDVCRELFGLTNASRINGVSKLVARFNKEVLQHKLVIVEEVEVKKGSKDANAIKTLITEDSTTVEAKGLPSSVEPINCAFLLTTNHLPLWLEEADRRFFILNFDHKGYNNGGEDYENFTQIVGRLKQQVKTEAGIKSIYNDLMKRDLADHNSNSLNVAKYSTDIMVQLRALSPDVVRQQVEEQLEEHLINFVPVEFASDVVKMFAYREANAQTHLFSEMGWEKNRYAWNGGFQKFAWVKPQDNEPKRGKVWVKGGFRLPASALGNIDGRASKTIIEDGYEPMAVQVVRLKMMLGKDV